MFQTLLKLNKIHPVGQIQPGGITLHLLLRGREGCGQRKQSPVSSRAARAPPPWPPSSLGDLPLDPHKLQTFGNHPTSVMSFFQ